MIITELKHRQPELVYFDETYTGEYPSEAPFTIANWRRSIHAPVANQKKMKSIARRLWKLPIFFSRAIRVYCIMESYPECFCNRPEEKLRKSGCFFDLWKKESDAQPYIPEMVQHMKDEGYAYEDQGALVVDVKEESDTKEIPPCILLKSDGASLYTTTDLATIVERMKLFNPDEILYVVDKRQELHFIQVFRCARKTGW